MYKKLIPGINALALFACIFVLGPQLALAEKKTGAPKLEEIVVTAQKREQSLQDVPISVSAVTGAQLELQNRTEIFDLAKMVPGFTFKDGIQDSDRAIQIRGVGTSTYSRGVEQTVGTSVDGVVASTTVSSFLDFNDVERVEVLRGPQGMLFGKNASAGLLNITTKRPTQEFTAGLSGSYAEENEVNISGFASGPLAGDALLGKVSFYSNTRDGIIENTHPNGPDDFNDRDEWGAKVKLLYEPSDDLSFYLNYTHAKRDVACCIRPFDKISSSALAAFYASVGAPVGPENDKTYEVTKPKYSTEIDVYSLDINYQIGNNTLTSITSFSDTDTFDDIIGFGLTYKISPVNRGVAEIKQVTQEFRLTSPSDQVVSYVAGLYYYKNELDRHFYRIQDLTTLGLPLILSTSNDNKVDSESYAAFGQATWNINDATRLSLGLRYNHEEVNVDQFLALVDPVRPPFSTPAGIPILPEAAPGSVKDSVTDKAVSWRVILERDVLKDAMLYASVARGYKGPGANTLPSGVTASKPIVDPEIPTNYELGIKSEWLDGRLRANSSIFYTEFDDFQASLSDNQIPPSFYLDNAGQLVTEGLEFELTAQATDNLFLSGNLTYVDATFDEYKGAPCYPGQSAAQGCVNGVQDLSGKDLPYSPDLVVNLFARYDIALDSLPFNAYVQGSYHWQDEVQYETSNNPDTIVDSYGIADMALGIESDSGNYSVQLFVKNVFDKFYISGLSSELSGLGIDLVHTLEYDYTRRVGVSFKLNF